MLKLIFRKKKCVKSLEQLLSSKRNGRAPLAITLESFYFTFPFFLPYFLYKLIGDHSTIVREIASKIELG